jgi:nondiscriminating aspartyl-tRNA synthetase
LHRNDLADDLDSEAERQLCQLAQRETGIPAVFVLGFPLTGRPFYTAPRGPDGAANSFDLLFCGVEITTGWPKAAPSRGIRISAFATRHSPPWLREPPAIFDLGMPPHGGFAIGLERLTAQILKLPNVRQAVLIPATVTN